MPQSIIDLNYVESTYNKIYKKIKINGIFNLYNYNEKKKLIKYQ